MGWPRLFLGSYGISWDNVGGQGIKSKQRVKAVEKQLIAVNYLFHICSCFIETISLKLKGQKSSILSPLERGFGTTYFGER